MSRIMELGDDQPEKLEEARIQLGDHVKDRFSGIEGRCISITLWETSCSHIGVKQMGVDKDGKPHELRWFDEPNVDVIRKAGEPEQEAAAPLQTKKPGGPSLHGSASRQTR